MFVDVNVAQYFAQLVDYRRLLVLQEPQRDGAGGTLLPAG